MGMGGMGGAYATGNTFDNLKAKGELHGDLNERVARVTKKSRSMEMALKERVAEERRAAFFFALGKHQIEAANMLRLGVALAPDEVDVPATSASSSEACGLPLLQAWPRRSRLKSSAVGGRVGLSFGGVEEYR